MSDPQDKDKDSEHLEKGITTHSSSSNNNNNNRDSNNNNSRDSNNNNATTSPHRLAFRDWISERFTWSWFTCTQSTGGIAVTLSECPKQFRGLSTIGAIIFILNIALFLLFTTFLLLRWKHRPSAIRACFTTPPECYFFGSFWLTLATMILNMERYAVPHTGAWMITTIRVLFWMYAGVSLTSATVHMVVIAKCVPLKVVEFPSAAFILILNAMLTGTVAGAIAETQPVGQRVSIMVAGVAYQGLGWIMCMIFLTFTIGNLLEKGWPAANIRGGLFIMVGTTGFTIVALIGCARAAPADYGYFAVHPIAREVLVIVATWVGIFMWLFCCFSFGVSFLITVATIIAKGDGKWKVGMSWNNASWALIFPNVGWTISTIYLGQELESEGIIWVSVAMVIALVATWLLDLFLMTKASFKSIFIDSRIKVS